MRDALIVFAAAMAVVVLLTPLVGRLALRLGAVDEPEERRIHERRTPRLGGLAIFAGVVTALGVGAFLPRFREVFTETSEPQAVLAASIIVVVLGLVDDLRGVSAPAKLAGQIMAGGTLALLGVSLTLVYIPPDTVVALGTDLAALFTVVAIVAMINAVNLVDGLDGLAAGIVAIAAIALFTYVQFSGDMTVGLASSAALLLAAVAGACVGFLFYNFNPASIFMGDTGAMLLGLLLGAAGISAIGGTVQPSRGAFAAFSLPVAVPALVLAVPFADTVWTILRRLRSGRAVFSPDKRHLHHRLVELGHSQRRAVLTMYFWSALLAFAAVGVSLLRLRVLAGVLVVGVGAAALAALLGRMPQPRGRHAAQRRFVSSFTKSATMAAKDGSDQRKQRQRQL